MLIDLLDSENYLSINKTAAQIFGLTGAAYCAELIKIYKKAQKKKTLLDDDYFKIDRSYIYTETTLSQEEQLKIDLALVKLAILSKKDNSPDVIKFNMVQYFSILTSEDLDLLASVAQVVNKKGSGKVRVTQREAIKNNFKNSIQCSNYELLTALRNWVDTIYANPTGYLSKHVIQLFQDTLNKYTQGDLDLALRIVNIAIAQGYKNCDWAINVYESDKAAKQKKEEFLKSKLPRVTDQPVATRDTVGKDVF